MDEADLTQARAEAEEELARRRRENAKRTPPRADGLCGECEEPVEPVRLAHGFPLCYACAAANERLSRHYRGRARTED